MGKISKNIRLITPVLSPLLREGSDRKTVKQKIMNTFAPGHVSRSGARPPMREAIMPRSRSPLSGGGMVSATGTLPGIKTGYWSFSGVITRGKIP
jgi:hypothetical protein